MGNITFKPLSLALFAMMSTGALSAQHIPAGILANGATPSTSARMLYTIETIGSSMGDASGVTLRDTYFYDNHNNLVRIASTGRNYKTGEFGLNKYYYYQRDEAGKLLSSYYRQYGLYGIGDEMTFRAAAGDSISYVYNEAGQLVKQVEYAFTNEYEYDADGNLVKETRKYNSNGVVYQQQEYSHFVAPNLPAKVVSTSDKLDDLRYTEDRTYNDKHLLLKSDKYVLGEDFGDDGMPVETKKTIALQENTYYDNGDPKSTVNYGKDYYGNLMPTDSVTYKPVEGKPDSYLREDFSWYDDSWAGLSTSHIYTYKTFDVSLAATISVKKKEGAVGTNEVTFDVPDFAKNGKYQFCLLCDGAVLDTAVLADPAAKTYTFIHEDVRNGNHDYMLQTLVGDAEGKTYDAFNVSNLVMFTNNEELPVVKNLHIADYKKDKGGYSVQLAWDEISDADKETYKFRRYDVVLQGMRAADNLEDAGQKAGWGIFAYTSSYSTKVDVQAYYNYGRSHNYIDVNMKDIIAGISQNVAEGVEAHYASHQLQLSQPANVKIYDAAGAMVHAASGVQNVSLENYSNGTYVVLMESAGKVAVLKLMR